MIYRKLCCCNFAKEPALPNIVSYPPQIQSTNTQEIVVNQLNTQEVVVSQPKTQNVVKINAQNKIRRTNKLEIIKEEIIPEEICDKNIIRLHGSVNLSYEDEDNDSQAIHSTRKIRKKNFIKNVSSNKPIDMKSEQNIWSITSSETDLTDNEDFIKYSHKAIAKEINKIAKVMKIPPTTEVLILQTPMKQFATVYSQEECFNKAVASKSPVLHKE